MANGGVTLCKTKQLPFDEMAKAKQNNKRSTKRAINKNNRRTLYHQGSSAGTALCYATVTVGIGVCAIKKYLNCQSGKTSVEGEDEGETVDCLTPGLRWPRATLEMYSYVNDRRLPDKRTAGQIQNFGETNRITSKLKCVCVCV